MLFCQLAHADSLREICNGLGCCLGKLVHLGIGKAPNKSTLSYANEHRSAQLYEELFYTALQRFRDEKGLGARKRKFRFKNKLLSLDSTTITLCLEMFPWARFRQAKGGVKAHVLLDHDDYLPRYVAADMSGALPPVPVLVDALLAKTIRQCLDLICRPGVQIIEVVPYTWERPAESEGRDFGWFAAITITRCLASGPPRKSISSPV